MKKQFQHQINDSSQFQQHILSLPIQKFELQHYYAMQSFISRSSDPGLKFLEKKIAQKIAQIIEKYENNELQIKESEQISILMLQIQKRLNTSLQKKNFPYFSHLLKSMVKKASKNNQIRNFDAEEWLIAHKNIEALEKNLLFRKTREDKLPLNISIQKKISSNSFNFPSIECPNCVERFYNNEILDLNQFHTNNTIFLTEKQINDQSKIKQWIGASANSSSGMTLFVGINPNTMKVEGIKYTKMSFNETKQLFLKSNIFRKKIKLTVTPIPIYEQLFDKTKPIKGLVILRIFVKPLDNKILYYVANEVKGFKTKIQFFIVQSNNQKSSLQGENIYSYMLKKYKCKKEKRLHWSSPCRKADQVQFLHQNLSEENDEQMGNEQDEIDFSYKYQSLVKIVQSKQEYFQKLEKKMKENNLIYRLVIPFKSIQNKSGWKFWLLCHENPVKNIRDLLPKKERSYITISTIELRVNLFDPIFKFVLEKFEHMFKKRFFGGELKIYKKYEKDQKYHHASLSFSNKIEALFTYIYLENEAYRPQFSEFSSF